MSACGDGSLPPTVARGVSSLHDYILKEVWVVAAGTKRYRKFRCQTKDCGFEYEAKPIPAYEVTHYCHKKKVGGEVVALKGVEEA